MPKSIRVVIADDHALVRESLSSRLDTEEDIEVTAVTADAEEALEAVIRHKPDILLIDIDMPGRSCFDVVGQLGGSAPDVQVVFLSAFWNDHYIEQALRLKARGCLTKFESPAEVAQALRQVHSGRRSYSQSISERLVIGGRGPELAAASTSRISALSDREREVLRFLAEGYSRREIARSMHLSTTTVATHTSNVMNKLDIHDRVELARFAIREGLVRV